MKSLSDLRCTSFESVLKLAGLTTGSTQKKIFQQEIPSGAFPESSAKNMNAFFSTENQKLLQTRPMTKSELGPIDMEKYLNCFGIKFNIKDDGTKTIYRLQKCIFNPDHGPNEASIIIPRHGPILYQCFHSSCKHHTWKEARRMISGDKSLAEFCEGYDPHWRPPRTTGSGQFSQNIVLDFMSSEEPAYVADGKLIPPPSQVDWREFYIKGHRDEFVPLYLVRYLQKYLHPLACTAKQFWKYKEGVWKPYSDASIRQHITRSLKEKVQGRLTDNVIKILADETFIDEEQWDKNPLLINCKSGMISIETGETIPHDPKYLSRVQLPVNYDPHQESVRWFEFLKDIFPEDFEDPKNSRTYMTKHYLLQMWFGYCLLRDNRFHKALFLYGTGSNGKSTVIEVLQAMVGEKNTSNLSLSDLCQRFKIQHLLGKMVNLATETGSRDPLAMDVFKTIIAGEKISAERKYGDVFDFRPYAKFCVSMNDVPVITDKSYGFERRIIVLSFNRRIEKHEIIPNIKEVLIEEIDGIFTWAIRGLQMLLKRNEFYIGETIGDDTDQFMKTINPLLIFGEECCEFHPEYEIEPQALWEAYKRWCDDGKNRPLGRNNFYNQILAQYSKVKKSRTEKSRLFRGIRLKYF
ncbi:MAG TPA: phage/plasmid primase, P4 family [Smithellaceae bacterium]|nr:phage/plasmid primase, P4 family [Smithellaceae bacterium]